ncbi:MAG: glucosaminidase domain-containing protein [Flavobacteriales bacterium]
MKFFVFILSFSFCSLFANNTPEQYIALYKNDAIKEMKGYGVPASITLAQGMLESSNGNSTLAVKANNHFGIKCHSDWTGDTYHMDDDAKNECFRKYAHVLDSYRDHSKFLKERSRYAALFTLKITDYKGWAEGLKAAGYATNPKYPQLLINLIERYQLYIYDSEIEAIDSTKHVVFLSKNHVKLVKAKEDDSFEKIAKEFGVSAKRLRKYNDAADTLQLKKDDVVFIQPKRKKGTVKIYEVKESDTYRTISQDYAIRLKYLYKKNNIVPGSVPKKGEQLYLKKKKK